MTGNPFFLPVKQETTHRGVTFKAGTTPFQMEQHCFLHSQGDARIDPFIRLAKELWPAQGSDPGYIWLHEDPDLADRPDTWWNYRMLEACCNHSHVGITGPGHATKSHFFALWALINWIVAPKTTHVMVGSTQLAMAEKRIWGSVRHLYQNSVFGEDGFGQISGYSQGKAMIYYTTKPEGKWKPIYNEKSALALVAPDNRGEKVEKLIGAHNERVIFICDEATGMPLSVKGAMANLAKNPFCQFISIGNANEKSDLHGVSCQPRDGWKSVDVDSDEWPTKECFGNEDGFGKGGICLHFDGLKSANFFTKPVDRYKHFLISSATIESETEEHGGSDTTDFWRFVRGFWAPSSADNTIYSVSEFEFRNATKPAIWQDGYQNVMGIDPALTAGGDRFMVVLGRIGISAPTGNAKSKLILEYQGSKVLRAKAAKGVPESIQFAEQVIELAHREGVPMVNIGIDATVGGIPVADQIDHFFEIKPGQTGIHRCNFREKPTMRIVSAQNKKPARDVCFDRVSELWHVGKGLVLSEHFRGFDRELMDEICLRKYAKKEGGKIRVEPKTEFRKRLGRSCDHADSFWVMVDLCRERFGLQQDSSGGGLFSGGTDGQARQESWNEKVGRLSAPGWEELSARDAFVGGGYLH